MMFVCMEDPILTYKVKPFQAATTTKMKSLALILAVSVTPSHAFFSYPSLSSDTASPKTFFNVTSNIGDNLLVLNKTHTANSVGFYLASAFLAYTLLYTYEENNPSSKVDSVLGFFKNNEVPQSKGFQKERDCDCETYCTNKYYYPESESYYSKRWGDMIESDQHFFSHTYHYSARFSSSLKDNMMANFSW